jgi:hypothetical protein
MNQNTDDMRRAGEMLTRLFMAVNGARVSDSAVSSLAHRLVRQMGSKVKTRKSILTSANTMMEWLSKPSDRKHIPEALRGAVAELLDHITMESRSGAETIKSRRWNDALNNLMARMKDADVASATLGAGTGEYVAMDVDPDLETDITNLLEGAGKLDSIMAMTPEQLDSLDDILDRMMYCGLAPVLPQIGFHFIQIFQGVDTPVFGLIVCYYGMLPVSQRINNLYRAG